MEENEGKKSYWTEIGEVKETNIVDLNKPEKSSQPLLLLLLTCPVCSVSSLFMRYIKKNLREKRFKY